MLDLWIFASFWLHLQTNEIPLPVFFSVVGSPPVDVYKTLILVLKKKYDSLVKLWPIKTRVSTCNIWQGSPCSSTKFLVCKMVMPTLISWFNHLLSVTFVCEGHLRLDMLLQQSLQVHEWTPFHFLGRDITKIVSYLMTYTLWYCIYEHRYFSLRLCSMSITVGLINLKQWPCIINLAWTKK